MGFRLPGSGGIGGFGPDDPVFSWVLLATLIVAALLAAGVVRRGLRARSNAAFAVLLAVLTLNAIPLFSAPLAGVRDIIATVCVFIAVCVEVVTDIDGNF